MTDFDINQTSIISTHYIQNAASEPLPACPSLLEIYIMMRFDIQEIWELESNLEATQFLNFSNLILW